MTTLKEKVTEFIENMSDEEQIELHNNYASEICAGDAIYPMRELDFICEGKTPTEIIRDLGSNFSLSHDYFYTDGSGNLQSFNRTSDDNSPISISDLTNWIVNNDYLDEIEPFGFVDDEEEEEEE